MVLTESSSGSSATRLSLISRIRVNDARAWQDLVALYSPLVAHWCRKRSLRESDINDIVQEVFFSVARSIEQFQPNEHGGSFRGWLWTVTRHKLIDFWRREQHSPTVQGGSTAWQAVQQIPERLDESDASERSAFGSLLHRALEQVRGEFESKSWQAFWRSTIDGVPVAAVAAELSISPATVRQHRSRILRRLRQQLEEPL